MMALQYAAQKMALIHSICSHDGGGAYWHR